MPQAVNGQVYMNIDELPVTDEILPSDKLIVETENGTQTIYFENFLITKDNITFSDQIDQSTSNVTSLSSQVNTLSNSLTVAQSYTNAFFTVVYRQSGSGFTFDGEEVQLPLNVIQSNTIDGNITGASSTKAALASNLVSLNPGTYMVDAMGSFSGAVLMDIYNTTTATPILNSNYGSICTLRGTITILTRSDLMIRGWSNASRTLGAATPFSGKSQVALVATFQMLSSGIFPRN